MNQQSDKYLAERLAELKTVPDTVDLVARLPIGGVVKTLRLFSGFQSQSDLADRCGLTESFVRKVEEGGIEGNIDRESITKLARAFNMRDSVLVFMFELGEALQDR